MATQDSATTGALRYPWAPLPAEVAAAQVEDGSATTPEEILVLTDILARKTNTYIYDPLKRRQLAAGDGAPSLKPRPVKLDSIDALLAVDEDDTEAEEHEEEGKRQPGEEARPESGDAPASGEAGTRAAQREKRRRPDDAAAEEYAARRAARETRRKHEENRSEQYLLELRIRDQIAQAAQHQEPQQRHLDPQQHVPYYQPPSAAVTSSAPPLAATSAPPTPGAPPGPAAPCGAAAGLEQPYGANAALGAAQAYAWPATGTAAEQQHYYGAAASSSLPYTTLSAMHPTAAAFLRSGVEALPYSLPQHSVGKGGKGGKGGPGAKGKGKGFHNGQEICKEYHRKFGRCTYADRVNNPRGCRFYHASDEELQAAMARLGSDPRYDLYDEVCLLLWERRQQSGAGGVGCAPRGLFAPAEL